MSTQESNCKTCSSSISNLAYKCNYCGSTFCQDHRIPENHDCVGLELVKRNDEQWGLGMMDVETNPSKSIDIQQAVDLLQSQRTEEADPEKSGTEPVEEDLSEKVESQDESDQDSKKEYMELDVRDRAEDLVDRINSSAPDLQQYKKNPEAAYDTVEPMVYSSSVEPDYESSPDVSFDGSIKSEGNGESDHGAERTAEYSAGNLGFLIALLCIGLAVVLLLSFVYF